jgi:nitrogen regulatory protein P-II 1
MKQIKAFVHRNRVSDIVHALDAAGFTRLSLFDVKGMLRALSAREQEYSVELGEKMINEVQMELFCEDNEAEAAIAIFSKVARTGKPEAGWIYVSEVGQSIRID